MEAPKVSLLLLLTYIHKLNEDKASAINFYTNIKG